MPELTSLPVEILHSVFAHADQDSRKSLRLANRHLAEIGQQCVFQTIAVQFKFRQENHVNEIENILKRKDLVSHIAKIYVNTFDLQEDQEWMDEGDTQKLLEILVGYLKKLPRLQSVVLRFHPECPDEHDRFGDVPQDEDLRTAVMKKALSTLAAFPQLKELALRDLWNVHDSDPKVTADLYKVLARLRSLRLNIINVNQGMSGSSDYHREAPLKFWPDLPSLWLKPALSGLQHLTLYSSIYVGFFPKCDFRDLHFPQLKTVAFGNHTFVHDSQLDWILSHGETLEELYLDDCAIVFEAAVYIDPSYGERTWEQTLLSPESFAPHPHLPERKAYASYSTRWADYFRAFKDKLPHLRHFRYGHAQNWWEDDSMPFESEMQIEIGFHRESYLVFCDGYLPSEYRESMLWDVPTEDDKEDHRQGERLSPSEEDKAALEELCMKFGQKIALELDDY
ncbi:hypothetical protein BJX99DRAFT_5453 [Aspergillus californicus]